MKNYIFLTFFLLFLFQSKLKAQEFKEGSDLNDKRIERINKALNLSKEQLEKAKGIEAKYKPEIEKIVSEATPLRNKIKSLREKKINEFESILSQEQKAKLIHLKNESRGKYPK